MIDKGLDKLLMGFFGTTGMTILIFAGTQPMPLTDRLLTIAIGATGLICVLVRALSWRSRPTKISGGKVQAEVEA